MAGKLHDRISVRLLVLALAPALLVSAALSIPMIELRRAQMLAEATEHVIQAGRTTEALYRERIDFAALLAGLLAERAAAVQDAAWDDPDALAAFAVETREHTLFDLVALTNAAGMVVAQDGATVLWRAGAASPLTIWGAPDAGVVVTVRAPIPGVGAPAQTFMGAFALDEHALIALRERAGIEQSLLVDGVLVVSSHPARASSVAGALSASELAALREPLISEVQIGTEPYLARYKPLYDHTGRVVALAELLLPLAPVHAAQRQATLLLLVITLLAVLAALLLAFTLARWVALPIGQLGRAAAAIGCGELDRVVRISGPSELVALGGVLETARQQLFSARAALAEEKQRYAAILESISEALITLNARGHVTGMNSAAEALLGQPRSSAAGRPLAYLLPGVDGQAIGPERLPTGSTLRIALRLADGQPRTIAATRYPLLGPPGAAREYVLMLRDISDEVAVAQLKEAFLANITHEFQTPLAALLASLELLHDEREQLSAQEHHRLLEVVYSGARRLQHLVGNLLDSASLQAGYFRVEPELSDLRPLVAEAVATVEPVARRRGQQIVTQLPAQLPPLFADEPRLIQAMVNLLANASKFGPPGDVISLGVTVDDGSLRIAVTDHGPGVDPARQAHLFERFLRPGAETVRAQGVGLGLAITRAIVERHGGTVRLAANARKGTTFTIDLPQADMEIGML
jgi:PAS domain S-box-containing protein